MKGPENIVKDHSRDAAENQRTLASEEKEDVPIPVS